MKVKSSRFDSLVARYYPAVYNFASRLTDDPREAVVLTHDAFKHTKTTPEPSRRVRSCINPYIRCNSRRSYDRIKPSLRLN